MTADIYLVDRTETIDLNTEGLQMQPGGVMVVKISKLGAHRPLKYFPNHMISQIIFSAPVDEEGTADEGGEEQNEEKGSVLQLVR